MKRDFLLVLASSVLILIIVIFFSMRASGNNQPVNPNLLTCNPSDLTGKIIDTERLAIFEGEEIGVPDLAFNNSETDVLGVSNDERWIEVDLSEQKLKAWEGGSLFLETAVSTGLPFTPTPKGEYRIWIKLRAAKMSGGTGRNYYYLPNVPYIMYFYKGYGLHGTYWHNDFGNPRSHGCVNLPTPIAERLYYWVSPVLPEGKSVVHSTPDNPGTRIVIHE